MGDSRTARQVEDGTHGPGRLLRVSTGPASPLLPLPRSVARRWPPAGTFQHQEALIRQLRRYLHAVCAEAGIAKRIVPHQLRHTYASEMLRSGVEFLSIMKLLGHASPEMTMLYLEVAPTDLQREFHLARTHPRHLAPQPKTQGAPFRAGLDGAI